MIKKIFLFALLLANGLLLQAQTNDSLLQKIGGITFKDQVKLDTAQIGVMYQFSQQATNKEQQKIMLTDTLLLAVGNNYSIFLDPNYKHNLEVSRQARKSRSIQAKRVNMRFDKETIEDFVDLQHTSSDYKVEDNGNPVQIYKNRETEEIISVYNKFVDNLKSVQLIPEMNEWELLQETDTILGYNCLKATTSYAGRKYEVWFAPDIPFNDGPWKFYGLPGLILKAEDENRLFQFVAIGLEQYKQKVEIVKDDKEYDNGTMKNFNKLVEVETGRDMVSFYHNNELYMTYKKRDIVLTPMELEE